MFSMNGQSEGLATEKLTKLPDAILEDLNIVDKFRDHLNAVREFF